MQRKSIPAAVTSYNQQIRIEAGIYQTNKRIQNCVRLTKTRNIIDKLFNFQTL